MKRKQEFKQEQWEEYANRMSQVESNAGKWEMTKYMAEIGEDVSEEGNKWRVNRRGG